jgi:hypothetical protein
MAVLVTAIHDVRPHPRGTEVVDTRHSPGMTRKLTHYRGTGARLRGPHGPAGTADRSTAHLSVDAPETPE